MAKARTPEEDVPAFTRFTRMTGQRGKDIGLAAPPGSKRDPRLPASTSDVQGALGEASKGLSAVRKLTKRR
jgi:hypothetical protein